ncbi:MAG: Ig-like domain-containing protein [Thermoleophilia bacterium]
MDAKRRAHGTRRTMALAALAVAAALPATRAAATAPPACSAAGLTVTALHGPYFYIDSGNTPALMGAYAGYGIADTSGSPRTDTWVKLASFAGGSVTLGTGQAAAQQIASLAANGSTSRFFYLKAASATATAQTHLVQVWQGRPDLPGSTQLCEESGGFASVQETIKAAANKLTEVAVNGGAPALGKTFTVTVKGQTGTIGSGLTPAAPAPSDSYSFWMSPSAAGNWPADAYRLVGTNLAFSDSSTYADTLRVAGLSSTSKDYEVTYTFRAIGFTTSATPLLPVQQITSGTQIKHTDLGSLASLPAISPVTNNITGSLTSNVTQLPASGGNVDYTASFSGTGGAVLDTFEVTIPAGATFVSGSAQWNGVTIGDPVLSGGKLVFQGPFTLGAGSNPLTFTLMLPGTSGDKTTSLVATVGDATVDSTTSLTDNAPPARVVNVDTAPDAVDDTVSVASGATTDITVLGNDTDADGDTLSVTAVGTATNGTASVHGNAVRYTPTGAYTVTYDISDGRGGTDTATVNITVVAPSGPIAATDDPGITAAANGNVDVDVLANDTGDGTLGIQSAGTPGHGTATIIAGPRIRYTPTPGWSGTDTFTYTMVDGVSRTATATVTVTVSAPPASAPSDDAASVAWDGTVLVDVLANDPGGATLDAVATQPGHGTAVIEGTSIRYTPDGSYAGSDTFTYRVNGSATPATVTVTVTPPAAPQAADDTVTAGPGDPVEIDVTANDSGADLTLTGVTQPGNGTVTISGGRAVYTPAPGFLGDDTFTYTVTDAVGNTSTATVRVTVRNGPPVLDDPGARTVTAGGTVAVDLAGTDPDGDALTYSAVPAKGWKSTVSGSRLRLVVPANVSGRFRIPVRVSDGLGGSADQALDLVVLPQAPGDGSASVAPDPAAVASLGRPTLVGGRPRSRTLAGTVDTVVSWDASPNASVVRYRVLVNGALACTVDADGQGRHSCRLRDRALDAGDDVRVVAVGADDTRSARTRIPVVKAGPTDGPLVAVVYFASADFSLDADARQVLARVSALARRYGLTGVTLAGHTDSDNGDAYNLRLSAQRAAAVRDYVRARYPRLVSASTGFGEGRPVLSNATPTGKAVNRRVEVYLR